jgi:RNA-binding protein
MDTKNLQGFERKYLRGLAHGIRPVILIGKEGLTDGIVRATAEALLQHELIKIKYNDFKEKSQKEALTGDLAARTGAEQVGAIGHTVILFRPHPNPEMRRIILPDR